MSTRVLLIEDHQMVREALCEVLMKDPDIDVVGQAGDAADGLSRASALQPDVVVLDIRLPDLNGVEVVARLRDAGVAARVVALSAFSDKYFVTAMVRAGASAYVTKSAAGTELVRAIHAVARGEGYFSPGIGSALASEVRDGHSTTGISQLRRREREVLGLIAEGLRSGDIAQQLGVSIATVEVHRRNIMRKLGLHTVADLTKHAIREGIVPV